MNTEQDFRIFTDLWRLYRKYAALPDNYSDQDGWAALINDINVIDRRYSGSLLARKMLLMIADVLEEKSKSARQKDGNTVRTGGCI